MAGPRKTIFFAGDPQLRDIDEKLRTLAKQADRIDRGIRHGWLFRGFWIAAGFMLFSLVLFAVLALGGPTLIAKLGEMVGR